MSRHFNAFGVSESLNHNQDFGEQLRQNAIDPPNSLEIIFTNQSDPNKPLRTSARILNHLSLDILPPTYFTTDKNSKESFSNLKSNYSLLLKRLKGTQCFEEEALIEGQFENPISKYKHEKLNLFFRLNETNINSLRYGINVFKQSQSGNGFIQWQLRNLIGQCETIQFVGQASVFKQTKQNRIFAQLNLPYASPNSFTQHYRISNRNSNILEDLRTNEYSLSMKLHSIKDPRWRFTLKTTSHHFSNPLLEGGNPAESKSSQSIANSNSILNETITPYQNVVATANFTKSLNQNHAQEFEISTLKTSIGLGLNNKEVFAKVVYDSSFAELAPIKFSDSTSISGLFENNLSIGALFARDPSKVAFVERFTLRNRMGYSNLALNKLNINSDQAAFGSRFYATNHIKYSLTAFPLLERLGISPFIGGFVAFLPTDLKVSDSNKIPQYIEKNVRCSLGVGLSFALTKTARCELVYNFAELLPKKSAIDSFAKFQLHFYAV